MTMNINIQPTDATIGVLSFDELTEVTVDHTDSGRGSAKIVNIDRDDDKFVTVYLEQTNGRLFYLVIDQNALNALKTI